MDDRENTEATLRAYAREADLYSELTRDADFAWWLATVRALRPAPARLLDLGSGSGRDLRAFAALGYEPHGVEGCAALARGQADVRVMNLMDLALEREWDLVSANAVLHHLPDTALEHVLRAVAAGLREGGALVALVPSGGGEEGWARGRFVRHLSAETWRGKLGGFRDVRCTARERWLVLSARQSV